MPGPDDPQRLDLLARLVVAALRRVLPGGLAADVLGDLIEDYGRRHRGRRRWLIRQAWDLGRGLRHHRFQDRAPRRPRTVPADIWLRDLRYAVRSLFRARGFAAVALLSLALGIGLATAVFSVVDGILLRPLPYGEADAIVRLREATPPGRAGADALPRPLLRYLETGSRTLQAVGPFATAGVRVTADHDPVAGIRVDVGARFFEVLRTSPLHGRLLGPADDEAGAPWVAVLSQAFWQRVLGGDAAAVGRQIRVDDRAVHVVGVLPSSFTFPAADAALYMPGRWRWPDAAAGVSQALMGPSLDVVARMRPGVETADVEHEMAAWAMNVQTPQPPPVSGAAFRATPLRDDLAQAVRPALVMLLAAVACVLAIVCVNLTNLLLARATVRQREMAVRAALGATRWGMARPLVLEGLLLSVLGGALGLAVASLLVGALPLTASIDPTLAAHVRIDARVLAFTLAISTMMGVTVGVLPAWQAPAADVKSAVSGSRVQVLPGAVVGAERMRSGLVVIQIALAMVLAVAAALLSRSLVTLLTVDLGFDPTRTLGVEVKLPPNGGGTYDWQARFYEQFVEKLSAHPGVRAVGFTTSLPMRETFSNSSLRISGVAPPPNGMPFRAHREVVTPGYFTAIGLRVVRGRALRPTDTVPAERVLIVNEAFADTFLPGRDALGQLVMVFGDWHRIVGIARSKRQTGLRSQIRPEIYVALAQAPPDVVSQAGSGVVLRAMESPGDLLPFVRSILHQLQPMAAVESGAPLEDDIWSSSAQPRFYAGVMGAFAVLALVTALVGLFGVLSYAVERRRLEFGVRRALGATAGDISRLVVGSGLRLVALAFPLGLLGAYFGARLLRTLLFGIHPADAPTFAAVLAAVTFVSLAACAWPARRAVRIEPLDALRED